MSNDLETLLRETLASRAETVTSGPAFAGAPTRRARRWIAPLAAAATVVVVAGAVEVGVRLSRSDRPTHPRPVIPNVCTTSLPASWQHAVTSAGVTPNGTD